MILANYTPFVPLFFAARNVADEDFWVLVLKGTFRIVPNGRAAIEKEQDPITTSDAFFGEPHTSSLRMEDDLAPFKKKADILVNAVARSPNGPAKRWDVRVRVGKLEKKLRVTGRRAWVRTLLGGYELTEPEPELEVPIRYERAFGGTCLHENPIGCGHVEKRPSGDVIIAPQIEDPADPIGKLGPVHRPEGLLPMTRSWLPRRAYAGTPDEKWQKERWPNLPLDFDDAFYNCAHPDLVYPGYLSGDEEVELEGLSTRPIRFRLPGLNVSALGMPSSDTFESNLDTLFIDVPKERIHLVWRWNFPMQPEIEAIGIRAVEAGDG